VIRGRAGGRRIHVAPVRLRGGDRFDRTALRRPGVRPLLQPLEVDQELPGGLASKVRVFVEGLQDDHLETEREAPVHRARRSGIFAENRLRQLGGARFREEAPTRREFIEDGAERIEIRPRVHPASAKLLGGHVRERPRCATRCRLRRVGLPRSSRLGCHEPRESEVEDLDEPVRRKLQVCGLQVPVDDPLLMGGLQPAGDLGAEADHRLFR
jgi:hypothetical protein